MKKILFSLALSAACFGANWTGYVSDEKCGKGHADGSEKSAKCVAGCVKGGKAAVFVAGDKVFKLDAGSQALVKDHLGHKVTLSGKLSGDTISIKKKNGVKMAN
jgi:hypothetical protein